MKGCWFNRGIFVGVLLWLALATGGLAVLARYQAAEGTGAQAPVEWPSESSISRPSESPVLLMFAHPRCPCTRASVAELARLMANCYKRAEVHVLFAGDVAGEPEQSDLWASAAAIPGVKVRKDGGSREARLFGAQTSGQTLLFSPEGKLLFSGGITASRGHEGDNAGRSAVASLVLNGSSSITMTEVFGCELHDDAAASCGAGAEACLTQSH